MFPKCKKLILIVLPLSLFLSAYTSTSDKSNQLRWIKDCLSSHFNAMMGKTKLKKWELNVTNEGFLRLKKFYPNGKQEYFSFNVNRFKDLHYLGTDQSGEVIIKTITDDVIVQTYNDPRGNIDSMASEMKILVTMIEAEQLDSLRKNLQLTAK